MEHYKKQSLTTMFFGIFLGLHIDIYNRNGTTPLFSETEFGVVFVESEVS